MFLGEVFFDHSITTNFRSSAIQALNQLLQRKDLGFFQLPERDLLWNQTQKVGQDFAKSFEHFIWVGIGGSSLGPKAICQALNISKVTFVESPDIVSLKASIEGKSLEKIGFIFVSKSGTTIESLTNFQFYSQELKKNKLSIEKQSLVITESKTSSLYDWAKTNKCPQLEIPLDVGGRFSVLTAVGQLIFILAGLDLNAYWNGAKSVLKEEFKQNTLLPMIEFFISGLNKKDVLTYFWYYCDNSYLLGKWLEQLWAESLSKDNSTYVVSVPIVALGPSDQHSILQQMVATQHKKSIVIHRFEPVERHEYRIEATTFNETRSLQNKKLSDLLRIEAEALRESQKQINNSVLEIQFQKVDGQSIAQYFMSYQLVVGALGEYMKINAFDQPGVELGKVITKKMLQQDSQI